MERPLKVSRSKLRSFASAGVPLAALLISFTWITQTTIKILLMASVLLMQSKRTIRLIDGVVLTLFLFLVVYGLVGILYNNYDIVVYQLWTFPVLAYLLGKSFSSSAPNAETLIFGLFLISIVLAIFPVSIALNSIATAGFVGGGRGIYVDEFGVAISATVMGGPLTLAMSQTAASLSAGWLRRGGAFLVSAATAMVLLLVALRLGSRTQVVIFIISLMASYWFQSSGHMAALKKVIILCCAILLFVFAGGVLPSFLDSDYGAYFRDRVGDSQYGAEELGGRTVKWAYALRNLIENPMGWGLAGNGYSHNLWLDVARVSGLFGLLAALAFTVAHLRKVHRSLRYTHNTKIKKSFFVAIIAANLLFMLEPIMDGFLYVFYAYCAVVGMAVGTAVNGNLSGLSLTRTK